MNKIIVALTGIGLALPANLPAGAENISHLNQLLTTNECQGCELSDAGLVMSNLAGANLAGANLVGANLSRANLKGANLSGANLSGASLHGANLSNADLSGALLYNADLRNAYLFDALLTGVELENAYLQGAVGIPDTAGSAQQFYVWGLGEDRKGNYNSALSHYNRAIALDPELAPAYLGRAVVQSRFGNSSQAIEDAETAANLFQQQENGEGYQLANHLIKAVQTRAELDNDDGNHGSATFVQIVNAVVPLMFKFFMP